MCGLFSLGQAKVVHEPTILAVLPYFKQIRGAAGDPPRPRVNSEYGDFEKHRIYLERCDYLFWKKDRLKLITADGLVVIDKHKGLLHQEKPKELIAVSRRLVMRRCVYRDEYGMPSVARVFQFRYISGNDEQVDETRYLENSDDLIADLDLDTATTDDEQDDDDSELPDYKVYDYDAIPAVIKDKFKKHIDSLTNSKAPEWLTPVLIFMAWCHANKYVTYTKKGEMVIDPFYEMPSEDAAHVIDAPGLYAMHDLQHLEHLLYVSPITGTYYVVLALEN